MYFKNYLYQVNYTVDFWKGNGQKKYLIHSALILFQELCSFIPSPLSTI